MKEKKGISLIVLIITIIVMIILAGAVILSLTRSGIIGNTEEAKIKSNLGSYQHELSLSLADAKRDNKNLDLSSIEETTFSGIKQYIPSISEADAAKYNIKGGELTSVVEKLTVEELVYARDVGVARGAEIFDTDTTYTKLYINPNPKVKPDSLITPTNDSGVWIMFDDESHFGAFRTGLQSPAYPQIAFFNTDVLENEEDTYLYSWENVESFEIEIDGLGIISDITLKRGWNLLEFRDENSDGTYEAKITMLTKDTLPSFVSPGKIMDLQTYGGVGLEHLGNYISTKPY